MLAAHPAVGAAQTARVEAAAVARVPLRRRWRAVAAKPPHPESGGALGRRSTPGTGGDALARGASPRGRAPG